MHVPGHRLARPQLEVRLKAYSDPQLIGQTYLVSVDEFTEEDNRKLDNFINQVEETANFYGWDGTEIYRQPRAHLTGTALAYLKLTPSLPP